MSNRDRKYPQAPLDSGAERVENLLRGAAAFVPEHSAPDEFCANALAKLNEKSLDTTSKVSARMRLNPFGAFAIGGATFALASLAFAIVLSGRPQTTPTAVAFVGPKAHTDPVDDVTPAFSTPKPIGEDGKPAQIERWESTPRPRHHATNANRFAQLNSFRRRWRAKRLPNVPLGSRPSPDQVAVRSGRPAIPACSCWTTEDVQQTNYVLVSPGIVTEGTGDSERATPVLVQLPISDGDYESSEGESGLPDTLTERH